MIPHPVRHTALAVVGACALAMFAPMAAHAQGTGRSMDIDLSIRSAGMGGASNAVCWGDLDHWGNPALLGYARGVRYVYGRTQLVPGLANDVILSSNVIQAGWGGLGMVSSGTPGPGGVRLNYGVSEGRDENGNLTGTFSSWETVRSKGAGISVVRAVESVLQPAGVHPGQWSRYGDVSLGMNWKRLVMQLAPTSSFGRGSTRARDRGAHARLTPFDGLDMDGGLPLRVDLAYGVSVLSYNDDATVTFISESQSSPVTRHHRRGGAVRVGAGRLAVPASAGVLKRAFIQGLTPLISFSMAEDHADLGGGRAIDYRTDGSGVEFTFANVLTYRHGHYEDLTGGIDGGTWGWGIGFPLGALGGLNYDEAMWPQAQDSGLHRVHRRQFTAWVDPIEVVRFSARR